MKMRDILSNQQSGESFTSSAVCLVCGHRANNADIIDAVGVDDRAAADSINSDAINQVGVSVVLPGADAAGEEAERVGFYRGESQPTNLNADSQRRLSWEEWYRLLWEFKVSVWDNNRGGFFVPLRENNPLTRIQESHPL